MRRRRHTGAVVDLVVDDHVEIFLQEGSALIARVVGLIYSCLVVRFTFEVCSDTSLKVNSLDILAVLWVCGGWWVVRWIGRECW